MTGEFLILVSWSWRITTWWATITTTIVQFKLVAIRNYLTIDHPMPCNKTSDLRILWPMEEGLTHLQITDILTSKKTSKAWKTTFKLASMKKLNLTADHYPSSETISSLQMPKRKNRYTHSICTQIKRRTNIMRKVESRLGLLGILIHPLLRTLSRWRAADVKRAGNKKRWITDPPASQIMW